MGSGKLSLLWGASIILASAAASASAQEQQRQAYDLPAQDLNQALRAVSRTTEYQLIADAKALRGKQSKALKGDYTVGEAISALLEGSDLSGEVRNGTVFVRGRGAPSRTVTADATDDQAIVITGSRIRGARPAAPVATKTRAQLEDQGFTDLGTFARSLPQSFSGGQNPGVISSLQTGSENFNSSSTLNLRGLGPDATLTLLNGHRLAYDATNQGVDISALPLAAIERVEVVADGASALYGSDAVGGVANIILRRDFRGVQTTARFGAATDGGDAQKQFSMVSGAQWAGGGFMIAGDYSTNTEIKAGQRSYTQRLQPGLTLLPWQRQISAVVAGHQDLAADLSFEIDGHISEHRSRAILPTTLTGNVFQAGQINLPKVLSYSVSPTLRTHVGDWELRASATRAVSRSDADSESYSAGNRTAINRVRYDDGLWSGELSFEGPVFQLPGGSARLALGSGIRSVDLDASINQITPAATRSLLAYSDSRTIGFGYGEASLPFVSAQNEMPLIRQLVASLAVRYEHYSGIGGLATPKLGLIWSPLNALTIKGTWGRSFKAPTLSQQNQIMNGTLLPATNYLPAPPDSRPVLLIAGGNPDLKPEKATTWTVSAVIEPPSIEGLRLEASYFKVRYTDRVTRPISRTSTSFTGTLYQDLIIYSPSLAQVSALVDKLPLGVTNQTTGTFDPANVGAIINNQFQNVASQDLEGIDLSAGYRFSIGHDSFNVEASASYLDSAQRLSANQPTIDIAGTIFNPPHWRGRGSANWLRDNVSLTISASYIGGTSDRRTATWVDVGDFTSFDGSVRVKTKANGVLADIDVLLSATNIFNKKPSFIASTGISPNYDAVNYSSIGRLISLAITKRW